MVQIRRLGHAQGDRENGHDLINRLRRDKGHKINEITDLRREFNAARVERHK